MGGDIDVSLEILLQRRLPLPQLIRNPQRKRKQYRKVNSLDISIFDEEGRGVGQGVNTRQVIAGVVACKQIF